MGTQGTGGDVSRDMQPVNLPWPIDVLVARPIVGGAFGAAMAILSVAGFVHFFPAYRASPSVPERLATADAVAVVAARGSAYVELTDATWDCSTPMERNDRVLLTAPEEEAVVVALFDGAVRCDYVAGSVPSGELRPLPEEGVAAMAAAGFDVEGRPVLKLCTYCGAGNNLLGVVLCGVFAVLGALMYPMCRYLRDVLGLEPP